MGKTKPPERTRTRIREEARAARKQVKQTERLASRLPGGEADHPIDVTSASLVEPRARAMSCPQCAGAFDLRRDAAQVTARGVLRAIDVVCRQCHAPRTLWFRVVVVSPS